MKIFYALKKYFENLINAIFIFDQGSIFKASGDAKELYGIKFYDSKRVSEIQPNKINTYPRLSLYENDPESKTGRRLIFDSSDFWYINNVFGKSVKDFSLGKKLEYDERIFEITEISIDILDIFDDYSTILKNKSNHSLKYFGKDTPYNIQIFITVNFLKYI